MSPTALASSTFTGFPASLFTFLRGLEQDNTKEYWEDNRPTWDEVIQPCVEDLMADLEPQFGAMRTFRPNRDVRFSKDKSPYKTWIGITTSDRAVGGVGSFARIEASGIRVATGAMAFAPDQVKQFRRAMDNPAAATEFTALAKRLKTAGLPVGPGKQPVLQRIPAGYADDHPHADLLKWKGAVVVKEYPKARWMGTPEARDRIQDVWSTARPLTEWIEHHVGESATPKSRRPR